MWRGLFYSTVFCAAVLVGANQYLPIVTLSGPEPEPGDVSVPAGSAFNSERPDEEPTLPSTETAPSAEVSSLPSVGTETETVELDTTPAAIPQSGEVETAIDAPQESEEPAFATNGEQDVTSTAPSTQPAQPVVDARPSSEDAIPIPETNAGSETAALALPPDGNADVVAPATSEESTKPVAEVDSPSTPNTETNLAVDAPSDPPDASENTTVIASPGFSVDAPTLPDAGSDGLELPQLSGIGAGTGEDSLPNIGPSPEGSVEELGPALERFSEPFAPLSDKPRLALVLIDQGGEADLDLINLPLPFAIALDPLAPGAALKTGLFREAGIEVLSLTPLPEGAAPADVEVAFQTFLDAVPQAVAVMDLPQAILQTSRPRSSQVVDILAASGHGLVTYEKGLNAALQLAQKADVPALTVNRVVDEGTSDAGRIKRFLDQGAFDATRAGTGVVVGVLRPEMLAALQEWSTGNRAQTVEFAPVSAVLMGK